MKKVRFVIGTIFLVVATVAFVFSTCVLFDSLATAEKSNDASALALIVTIPLAIVGYGAQFISTFVAVPCLLFYRRDYDEPSVRIASIAMTVLAIALAVAAVAIVAYLYLKP